jgi:hypothetical protein
MLTIVNIESLLSNLKLRIANQSMHWPVRQPVPMIRIERSPFRFTPTLAGTTRHTVRRQLLEDQTILLRRRASSS